MCTRLFLWLFLTLFSAASFAQQLNIVHVEIIQQGDSLSMVYAGVDSTSVIPDTTQALSPQAQIQMDTWVYVTLNGPLDSNLLVVSINKGQSNLHNFTFEEHQMEWEEISGNTGQALHAMRFHLGDLRINSGLRTARVSIKDPQGVELTHLSKPF
jgi:hypothetical protein